MLLQTLSKNHIILWKKQWTTLKNPKWSWQVASTFLRRREWINVCCACGCFLPKSRYTAYTLENYSNFKNKFLFNNGSILEINYYLNNRSRGNVSFTELSEIITTLSNQDFNGLDKCRLLEKKNQCFYLKQKF